MYSFHFNDIDGILEARATGIWTAATVGNYREDLAIEADAARKRSGKLRLLFNAADYAVQTQDVAQRAQQIERVVMPGDRIHQHEPAQAAGAARAFGMGPHRAVRLGGCGAQLAPGE